MVRFKDKIIICLYPGLNTAFMVMNNTADNIFFSLTVKGLHITRPNKQMVNGSVKVGTVTS
jgi:hypothetical protein